MADPHIMLSGGFFERGLVMSASRTKHENKSHYFSMGNAFTVPLNEEVTMGWSSLVSLTEDWVASSFRTKMRFATLRARHCF